MRSPAQTCCAPGSSGRARSKYRPYVSRALPRLRALATACAGLLASAALAGCGSAIDDLDQNDRAGGVASVRITTTGNRGTAAAPLPFSDDGVTLATQVEVRARDNRRVTSFNGWVALSMAPGVFRSVTGPAGSVLGNMVKLTNGVAEGLQVTVARGYGESRIWAEEQGYAPVDPRRTPAPACANGRDDDGDGFVDFPADLGCAAANDDTERAGSYAVGTSEPMFFSLPNIVDVQGRSAITPLLGERVTIRGRITPDAPPMGDRRHRIVVTQTDNSGFFVTDIDDTSCDGGPCYNSLYSFNFRSPDGMRPCDLIDTLTGSVAEFVSTTQLAQPGYQIGLAWRPNDAASGQCLIPDPVEITPTTLAMDVLMERHESSLTRARDVRLPTLIGPGVAPNGVPSAGATNCDLNGDGSITYDGGAENQCADACAADVTCSEWSNWNRYGQITVTLPSTGMGAPARMAVAPRIVNPGFDPTRPRGPVATVTGTLKQVGPNWIIQPRCGADFVVQGDGQTLCEHPRDCCLHERSIAEE